MEKENINLNNILIIYKNYLHSLQYREEFGDKYGDTKELIDIYEKKLMKFLKK